MLTQGLSIPSAVNQAIQGLETVIPHTPTFCQFSLSVISGIFKLVDLSTVPSRSGKYRQTDPLRYS